MMLSVTLSSMLMILNIIRHLICGNNYNWFLNLNMIYETLWTWMRSGLLISILEKINWFHLTGLISLVLLMWKWMSLLLRKKSSFKMLGLTFSSKLDWSSYIISIAKTISKKIGALIHSMKFLFPEVALYLYKSTIRPSMKYWCRVWASSCYLEFLDKLQKQICRTVGPSHVASLEQLAHSRNVARLSLFYRYYFIHLNWLDWFCFLVLREVYSLFW